MRKIFFCSILFLLILNTVKGQFVLENVYDTAAASTFYYNRFQLNGEKYVKLDYLDSLNFPASYPWVIRIYNLNHSLWKVIDLTNLPKPAGTFGSQYSILYVTDSLFNGDNLIEFMFTCALIDNGGSTKRWNTFVYNENLTLLFSDTTAGPFYTQLNVPQIQVPIVNTSDGTKMILATPYGHVKVYGIAGSLPTQYESIISKHNFDTEIYPNPSSDRVIIKYNLPADVDKATLIIYDLNGRQMKSYLIDKTFDNISLSTEELSSGTYFYVIETDNHKIIQGKKFVTVKN